MENGATYYVTQAVQASDENLDTVTVNGAAVAAGFTLTGDTEAAYAIAATDKAGNTTALTVTMKPLSTLEKEMEGLTTANVTNAARPRLEALEATLRAIDVTDATRAERDKVTELLARCLSLLERLDQLEWTPSPTATPVPTAAPAPTPTPRPAATARPPRPPPPRRSLRPRPPPPKAPPPRRGRSRPRASPGAWPCWGWRWQRSSAWR